MGSAKEEACEGKKGSEVGGTFCVILECDSNDCAEAGVEESEE